MSPAGVREAELVLDSVHAMEVAGPCDGIASARTLLFCCGSAVMELTLPASTGPRDDLWLRGRHLDLRPGAPAHVRVVLHGARGLLAHASSSLRGDFAFAVPSEPVEWIEIAPRDGPPYRLLLPVAPVKGGLGGSSGMQPHVV
jgi:hypothetical protein